MRETTGKNTCYDIGFMYVCGLIMVFFCQYLTLIEIKNETYLLTCTWNNKKNHEEQLQRNESSMVWSQLQYWSCFLDFTFGFLIKGSEENFCSCVTNVVIRVFRTGSMPNRDPLVFLTWRLVNNFMMMMLNY